ncbi:hypothetical protein MLPF_2004 [Mycobacterium lepromatosis]|nr:hypothetical protein MLPF_2004 [Mycobacterium lepromatosis]
MSDTWSWRLPSEKVVRCPVSSNRVKLISLRITMSERSRVSMILSASPAVKSFNGVNGGEVANRDPN